MSFAIIVELQKKVTENAKRGHIYLQVYTVSEKKKTDLGKEDFYIELLQKTETLFNNIFFFLIKEERCRWEGS